jgi:hypothetical protein
VLCIGSVAVAATLELSGSTAYHFLVGDLSATAMTSLVCASGALSLRYLERRGWFSFGDATRAQYAKIVALGMVLAVPVVVVDLFGGFPEGINVRAPESLAFYPAIAVVAEMVFHVVPLALVARVIRESKEAPRAALAVAALGEPTLQVLWGAGQSPSWANAYVGVHLLAFNAVEIVVLRRFGFLPTYAFRVAYYAIWHLAWGHARLTLLFG